ncbi:hypothetical protein AMATHDRAFT_72489 [Amanita thiersii Skay4041]|uniref:Poly A polymerase head domain-containing protein n=1 Tax=Amanita thiersii Skay4041 TaxID=703135 RepID=A0A2A9P0S4_9AGAR|nr:hypothetical protein AMATHDRAFT_72489 [Amanita thiersii Skay4041]
MTSPLLRKNPPTRIQIPSTLDIQLTPPENQLCTLLNDCTLSLKQSKNINTSCRIAGGWVRDKLLHLQCNDIDIALSDIMGLSFAEHLATFANERGVGTGTISKIAQNPDQSKHLETATLKLGELNVDLVNLRSEEYAKESRIPTQVTFGTPLQDALRRDITINTLFFNIHSRKIEDFTGKGLDDLRNGIIRTPLPPRETFLDDPLRILRCIRFASRFGFGIVADIKDAALDPTIQNALVSKVARERIGEEVTKMMTGHDPLFSIQLIHDMSLHLPIFSAIPDEIKSSFLAPPAPEKTALVASLILHTLLKSVDEGIEDRLPNLHRFFFTAIKSDPSCISRLFLASLLTPFAGVTYLDKKEQSRCVINIVLRESLKLGTQYHFLDGIPLLFAAHRLLKDPHLNKKRFQHPTPRVAIGSLLRHKDIHNVHKGAHWTSSIFFALVQDLVQCYDLEENLFDFTHASIIIGNYNKFLEQIEQLGLAEVTELKPLMDGRELIRIIGATKPGPWTGNLLARISEWQIEHPRGTKEACIDWLLNEKRQGGIICEDGIISEPATKRVRTT